MLRRPCCYSRIIQFFLLHSALSSSCALLRQQFLQVASTICTDTGQLHCLLSQAAYVYIWIWWACVVSAFVARQISTIFTALYNIYMLHTLVKQAILCTTAKVSTLGTIVLPPNACMLCMYCMSMVWWWSIWLMFRVHRLYYYIIHSFSCVWLLCTDHVLLVILSNIFDVCQPISSSFMFIIIVRAWHRCFNSYTTTNQCVYYHVNKWSCCWKRIVACNVWLSKVQQF